MSTLVQSAASWVNAGLGFLYPEVCQFCHKARATPAQSYICDGCRAEVKFIEPPFCARCGLPFPGAITQSFECGDCREMHWPFASARAAAIARGVMLEIIHRYKYQRALWLEPFLAELLIARAAPVLGSGEWNMLLPVPLHPVKQREREFNQAERLARRLSEATGVPMNSRLLRRVEPTRTQTQLSRAERLANVRRAFAVGGDEPLAGKRVVIVDDVLTTGATTGACAGVLRAAGAGDVCVWTVARGI
jgi:competence protein ComFC